MNVLFMIRNSCFVSNCLFALGTVKWSATKNMNPRLYTSNFIFYSFFIFIAFISFIQTVNRKTNLFITRSFLTVLNNINCE